jgi:hypothetical protein
LDGEIGFLKTKVDNNKQNSVITISAKEYINKFIEGLDSGHISISKTLIIVDSNFDTKEDDETTSMILIIQC